jgi:hypothetical protein
MIEAEERCALIEDVEEETFVRFIEFMYTNDYAVPDPDLDFTSIEEAPAEETPVCEETPTWADAPATEEAPAIEEPPLEDTTAYGWEPAELVEDPAAEEFFNSNKMKQKGREEIQPTKANEWCEDAEVAFQADDRSFNFGNNKRNNKQRMWSKFQKKAVQQTCAVWEPRPNFSPSENYKQVFLCHAQMYVLSDRYSIGPLRELCMQKLRLTLSKYKLFNARISDIVELVRYTYDHTMEHEQGMDKLRSLVLDYVVCHVETIVKHSAFIEMLQERGVLGKDLVLKMLQRLG